jgi:two-component system, sensor histidine kinase and response regulator
MKKQILIVEDENDCAELLRYHLQKEDYEAVIARNGMEAIEAVQRRTPDAVLLDIMMPELNGWEVCRILRESAEGKSLPIIMLTAMSDEEERIKGLSLGADDYVAKPYSVKELLLKIRKHIDQQQTIKQLKAREQEQDTALHYMVHELKNSLNVIGGYSSLAQRKNSNKYLKTIHAVASHAESLMNDASLLSRLEKEGGPLPLEALDIVAMAKDAVDTVRDMAAKKHVETVVMTSAQSFVMAHATAVRQVLVNLLSNAVKYNRKGGRVWVCFDELDDLITVSIIDEGCGIGCDELPRIFQKYYRAAGSEPVTGAGLGLYIVKLLTEAMGAKIDVVTDQGAGSTFTVTFKKAKVAELHSGKNVA